MNKLTYEVIIVGAGSIGTPAALALAQVGIRTLVIDAAPSPGQGANKAAIGGIRATHSAPAKISLARRSLELFRTWEERHGDNIEWQEGGYTFVAYREQEMETLQRLLQTQQALGLNIAWLQRDQMLEVVPDLNPDGLLGGTYSPEDGSASPLLAVHAFWRRARALGAEFRFGERLTEILVENGRVRGVRTEKGEYLAPIVINAAGGWARQVAAMAGVDLPVKPDLHEAAITEPVAPFLRPMVVDIRPVGGSANYYFYQHRTGQVIFCITPSPQIWGESREETSEFLPMVARRMVELMPRLQHLRVRRTWRGHYPMTPDGSPIIGWAGEADGLLLAAGMCGQGFMLGPGVGELLARMVEGRLGPADAVILEKLSPHRAFAGQESLK